MAEQYRRIATPVKKDENLLAFLQSGRHGLEQAVGKAFSGGLMAQVNQFKVGLTGIRRPFF